MEATHKLKQEEVPDYVNKYFDESWSHYDQNGEGYIRYEETHTFMRFLMRYKNKFIGAPGSITDLTTGGAAYKIKEDALEPKAEKVLPKVNAPVDELAE